MSIRRYLVATFRIWERYYPFVVFSSVLVFSFFASMVGWTHSLRDLHDFRQTQTALTTYYFIKDGFRIDYITPVFGAPWSIPIEFPLFQAIVALFVKLTNFPLDQAGRLFSLVFFYLSLKVLFELLKTLGVKAKDRLIVLAMVMVSPIYLFWSRTFLLESLALFLSLLFFLFSIKGAIHGFSSRRFFFAVLFGSLAMVVKVSTWGVFAIPTFVTYIIYGFKHRRFYRGKHIRWSNIGIFILLFMLPFLSGVVWTYYADSVKSRNPLVSDYLTSKALVTWTFGTITQKTSRVVFDTILFITGKKVIGSFAFVPFIFFVALFLRKYRWHILIGLISYFLAPIIFTNLYYLHDYYYYANSVFLLVSLGFAVISLLHVDKLRLVTQLIIIPGIIFVFLISYFRIYYPYQADNKYMIVELGKAVNYFTKPDDVVVVYGYGWNPAIAYYSQRKAIMERFWLPLNHPKLLASLALTGKEHIGALFLGSRITDPSFISEKTAFYGMGNQSVYRNRDGALYVRKADPAILARKMTEFKRDVVFDGISSDEPLEMSSANFIERKTVEGKHVLFVHAPGEVLYEVPGKARSLSVSFGIIPVVWDKPDVDGVVFRIDLARNGEEKVLFEQYVQPKINSKDRATQSTRVSLPKSCSGCRVSLKTLPGKNVLWDWSYWSKIQFQ